MERGMFIYPWDIMDYGIDETIRQLKAMNIAYVSVSLLYHDAKMLLPHNPKHHLYINKGGTCFYEYKNENYERLAPRKDPILDSYKGNFMKDVIDQFHKAGIRVCAWIVLFHNDSLAKEYKDCVITNCYGETSPTNLCPANPEVYAYGLNVVREVSLLGVDELHLESADYAGFLHGDHHEMQAYEDLLSLEKLLGICYCPHCIQAAQNEGINADRLLELAIKKAEYFFNLSTDFPEESEFEKLLALYLKVRQNKITSFYMDIKAMLINLGLKTYVKPILWLAGNTDPLLYGVDIKQIEAHTDGVIAAYPDSVNHVEGFVSKVRDMVSEKYGISGGIRLMAPHTTGVSQVRGYVDAYEKSNIDNVIFYNFGMAPKVFLEQLKEIKA